MASQTTKLDIQNHPTTKRSEATDDQPQLELEVPVIDLAGEMDAVVEEVKNACKGWGFFQVINHGVPLHLVQGIHECSKDFFGMPEEDKKKVKRDELNPMGYHDTEHTKNVRDWKEIFDFLVEEPNFVPASPDFDCDQLRTIGNQWPTSPSQFRVVCEEYGGEMEKLALKLIQIISLSLGLPADRLIRYFEKQLSFVRINHYPPCPFPDFTTLGCGRHKDPEVLTILAQDSVGGLEVKTMSNGQWVPVEPILGAFIINVGDIFQVWSNDRFMSVEHRVVVNKEHERYSFAFFLAPSHDVMVKPSEELVSEDDPAKYLPYIWGKFYVSRNRSDYNKHDVENIQIYDFIVPNLTN